MALGEDEVLYFEEASYDLEGIILAANRAEAAFVFMYYDEEDEVYYRNRYDILECDRGEELMLERVSHYLDREEGHGLFISFAAFYENKFLFFDGQGGVSKDFKLGDVELGENLIYGLLVRKEEGEYVFEDVLYTDGGLKHQSIAERVGEAGDLGKRLTQFIQQFE